MSPTPALRIALYLLVADGLVALHLGGFLEPVAAAAAIAALAVTWRVDRLRPRVQARPGFERGLVAVAAAASMVDILYLAETVLDGLVRLLLFLVFYKLVTLRTVRDTRTVGFLAFFMLVAASASAFGVGFLFVFVAFVVLATWVTLQQQGLLEAEPVPGRVVVGAGGAGPSGALLGLAVAASLGVLAITAGLFFVIPRVGLAALPLRAHMGPLVTGFSDRVELGAYGQIETDDRIIMRVSIPDWVPEPERLPNLRWRGVVLDEFDGRAWTIRHVHRVALRRMPGGDFPVSAPRGTGRILVQEVYLEPLGTEIIFGAPRVLGIRLRADTVNLDDTGSLSVPVARARLRYTVVSELERPPAGRSASGRQPAPLDPAAAARYLQLPPLSARIPGLARQVTTGSADPYEAALRLTTYLSREFRYTLTLERQTTLDPVEEFLFVRRAGNCEYFAAALAVMLRSVGIPARIVNGFQRGEWNPYGRYFMVRLRDAHSWVEAYVGGAGWVTLDPSPRGDAGAEWAFETARLYLDALRMRWQRYVINWSLRDQMEAAASIRRQATWGPSLAAAREWARGPGLAWSGVVVLVGGLIAWVWRRELPGRTPRAGTRLPRFYERALRALRRRGLRPEPSETAREFAARVARGAPACAEGFAALTAAYERVRFGEARLSPGEAAALEAHLAALARRDVARV